METLADRRPLLEKHKVSFPGVPTANPERVIQYCSPTHISSHRDCPRKCYLERVYGLRGPDTASTILGTRIHAFIEFFAKNGVVLEASTFEDDKVERIAMAGDRYFPDPARVAAGEILIEHEFFLWLEGFPVPFYGLIDVLDKEQFLVADHKSTSDFKWKKSAYQLKVDTQAIIYGKYALSKGLGGTSSDGRKYIDFQHNYFRTRGAPQADHERVRLYEEDIDRQLITLKEEVLEIIRLAQLEVQDTPFNTLACGNYGGCPAKGLCSQLGVPVDGESILSELEQSLTGAMPQENPMALAARFAALTQKKAEVTEQATPLNDLKSGAVAEDVVSTPTPTPTPPAIAIPPQMPRPAPAPSRPSINPPDGFPASVPGTLAGPAAPALAPSVMQTAVASTAAAEQEAKKAQAEAPASAPLPRRGRPPKVKDSDVVYTSPVQDATAPEKGEPATPPTMAGGPGAFLSFYAKGATPEVANKAAKDEAFLKAFQTLAEASAALVQLDAQADGVKEQYQELLDSGDEDAADDLKADFDKKVLRADRNKGKAEVALVEAASLAVVAATKALVEEKAAAEAAAKLVATPAVVPAAAAAPAPQAAPPPASGSVLCIGCRPSRAGAVLYEDFIAPYIEKAQTTHKVGYFRLLHHDANAAVVAELLAAMRQGQVVLPAVLVIQNYSGMIHGAFVESMTRFFAEVYS